MNREHPLALRQKAAHNRVRLKRADARRNQDRLVDVARFVLADAGPDASLKEIATRAGVGIGTIYRNFGSRGALLDVVYIDEIERVCASAPGLHPADEFVTWVRRLVTYVRTNWALAEAMSTDAERSIADYGACREVIYQAGTQLLGSAQAYGAVRADTDIDEVLHLLTVVVTIPDSQARSADRILQVILDGLLARCTGGPGVRR